MCGKSGCNPAGALLCSQAWKFVFSLCLLKLPPFDGVGERMLFLLVLLLGLLFVVVLLVVVVVELSDPFFLLA